MKEHRVKEYRRLKDSGVNVTKGNKIKYNAGGSAETSKHICAKALVGLVALRNGYRVDSEVEVQTRNYQGEIDVLLWGNPDRMVWAVECESSPTQETINRKVDQYVSETAVDDLQVINVTTLPQDMTDALGEIATELGLDP